MKDDIRNIINLENLSRVGSSVPLSTKLPAKDSIVKLVPLEYLEHGVKVLIDGKLYIAFIHGKIPIKEEIIALVSDVNPFALSLNLSPSLKINENKLVNQILQKFRLPKTKSFRLIIPKVIKEEKNIVKSKLVQLDELLKYIKTNDLEFSLLIDLVWNNKNYSNDVISDIYKNLFDESFEVVCNKLHESIKNMLFTELPQYLIQRINNSFIYDPKEIDYKVLLNKLKPIYELVKHFNKISNSIPDKYKSEMDNFIKYGTKYILQKSILKEYDYYPDFIMVNNNSEIINIHYSIKRIFNSRDQIVHKILFKSNRLPFQLKGIIRNKFLEGHLEVSESVKNDPSIISFEQNLFNHWGFRSELKINDDKKNELYLSRINSEVNKLVS